MFGISAAVMFAFTAAIMKEMNADISQGWGGVFLSWPPYVMAVTGLAGLFLAQNAFHAGPLTASQSALVIVDPFASIVIGIGLFGDQLQTAGGRAVPARPWASSSCWSVSFNWLDRRSWPR